MAEAVAFYIARRADPGVRRARHHGAEHRAQHPVPRGRLPVRGGALRRAAGAVPRRHPGDGLRGRHRRPLPVRRDAGEPEAAARGAPAIRAGSGGSASCWRRPCSANWRRSWSTVALVEAGGGARAALEPEQRRADRPALYTDYLVPFELASVLLLVAMIGAIVLAKRESVRPMITTTHYMMLSAALFIARRHRRHDAAQHHHRAHVDRADAERGEHQPDRLLAPAAERRRPGVRGLRHLSSPRPRPPSASASSSRSTATRKPSTSTR